MRSILFSKMHYSLGGTLLAIALLTSSCATTQKAPAPQMAAAAPALKGDPVHGEALYGTCEDCHSIDDNDLGPKHRGVFGRAAGAVTDYKYSAALKNSHLVWTTENLDAWLADPQKLVPGSRMVSRVKSAQDRADIIAYLATQK